MSARKTLAELIYETIRKIILRPLRNYNVDNRAERVMTSKTQRSAPRHLSTKDQMEQFAAENPELLQEQYRKPEELIERLKSVRVEGTQVDVQQEFPLRDLPTSRDELHEFKYGAQESETVFEGKLSLREVVDFLAKHQADPEYWTYAKIAEDTKLSEPTVLNILEHYRILQVYKPATKEKHGAIPAAFDNAFNFLKGMENKDEDTSLPVTKKDDSQKQNR